MIYICPKCKKHSTEIIVDRFRNFRTYLICYNPKCNCEKELKQES